MTERTRAGLTNLTGRYLNVRRVKVEVCALDQLTRKQNLTCLTGQQVLPAGIHNTRWQTFRSLSFG